MYSDMGRPLNNNVPDNKGAFSGVEVVIGVGVGVATGVGVGDGVGIGVGVGRGVGSSVGFGVSVAFGVGVDVAVGVNVGAAVGVGGIKVGTSSRTSLTITVWVASMSILAVFPDTPYTGPTHSSTSHPALGRTSMVTVLPNT